MSTEQIIKEIKSLSNHELQTLLSQLLSDNHIIEEMERLGYLRLSERSFQFWNDPREDVYQDYARKRKFKRKAKERDIS
jgi:hypothetical protein